MDLAPYLQLQAHTQGTQVRITQFYLQITPYLPLPRKRSPDGATTDWCGMTSNCSLLLMYRPWKNERLSWPGWLTYSGRFTHMWSPVSCKSSAGQGKFAGQRPTFYHCATQITNYDIISAGKSPALSPSSVSTAFYYSCVYSFFYTYRLYGLSEIKTVTNRATSIYVACIYRLHILQRWTGGSYLFFRTLLKQF